jgi:hypothetical protein
MSKAAKKRSSTPSAPAAPVAQQQTAGVPKSGATDSKQSHVIAMLQAPTGATISAMMKVTGWQQHSVRGFLAGVVRRRLKLKLTSKKVDGNRIYQIANASSAKPRSTKRRHKAS